MRLIDADALKEDLKHYFTEGVLDGVSAKVTFNQILHDIDNAPTIDLKDIYQEGHYDGQLEGYTRAINEERPQGEWIENVERRGCFVGDKTVYSYTCPFCGAIEFKKYPFCHCGADMRKGGAV